MFVFALEFEKHPRQRGGLSALLSGEEPRGNDVTVTRDLATSSRMEITLSWYSVYCDVSR